MVSSTAYRPSATPLRLDDEDLAATLKRVRALTRLMDTAVRLPGTNVTMGLDALLGLVPVVGDVASQLVSVYLITEARRLRAPKTLLARMIANTLFDTVVGSVPLVGDMFDMMFRANVRNLKLLEDHLERSGFAAQTHDRRVR